MRNGCEELLQLITISEMFAPIAVLLDMLGNPQKPLYIISLIKDYEVAFWVLFIPNIVLVLQSLSASLIGLITFMAMHLIPGTIIKTCISEMR